MQAVSKEYRDSMKSPLRERSYMQVSFGLINQEAQADGYINPEQFTPFSIGYRKPFSQHITNEINYATLENNFARVDGSQYLIPTWLYVGEDSKLGNCMVSNGMPSPNTPVVFTISGLNKADIKGLTVYFGENYPVVFSVITDTGQRLNVSNNDKSEWTTTEVFEGVSTFTFRVVRMKNSATRLRIFSVTMGIGLAFDNNKIVDSSLDFDMSPIGEYINQIDFSLSIDNTDSYFNVDNPKSAINFIETGQEMSIRYGYQLPNSDKIEWLKGGILECCDWEANDTTATIRCQDKIRALDTTYNYEYTLGVTRTMYEVAEMIFKSANISSYRISPSLKDIQCINPIPRVSYKEALQLVANACRCLLLQNRDGTIEIRSNYIPTSNAITVGQTYFSNVENVIKDSDTLCSVLTLDYLRVDGTPKLVPKSGKLKDGGYVSSGVSDSEGNFTDKPSITINTGTIRDYWELSIDFAGALPSEILIQTFIDETGVIDTFTIGADEISEHTKIYRPIRDCSYMNIIFKKSEKPHNRILVNRVALSSDTDFEMTKQDMTSSPVVTKEELVKEVIVKTHKITETTEIETLYEDTVGVGLGWAYEYTSDIPHCNYQVSVDDDYSPYVTVLESGAYHAKLVCSKNMPTLVKVKLTATKCEDIEDSYVERIQDKGKIIIWDNPLIEDENQASALAEWLANYYREGVTYEYSTRGNPELDVNDIITQDNDYLEDMKVTVIRESIKFSQALSGKVTTRRKGGINGVART